jgi:retron-type reverse transcriptase
VRFAPRPFTVPPPPPSRPAPAAPAAPRERPTVNPFANPEILGLSADDLRKRALRIDPYRTAWIGRVDTIPPQSDERTALIDRGLVLRGLLTEPELVEIHRIGDLWLKFSDAASLVRAAAHKTADEAVEALRKERAEKKAKKKAEAAARLAARVEAVARRRAEDVIYLGQGVSALLGDRRCEVEKLQAQGLPVLATPADVARALGLEIPRLRWLCFHSEATPVSHYVHFEVKKRSGGTRLLSAPHREMAKAQRWILREILDKLPVEPPAHGFVRGRSTVSNAVPHLGRDVVVNLDLKDFFPSVTFPRVRGVFQRLGYSPAAATCLALLCTEAPRRQVKYDGAPLWVALGPRALPQGAPTSPALSNQVVRKLDRRLSGFCARQGWSYTRYADDLTFSAAPGKRDDVGGLLVRVGEIVKDEGFTLHPDKGRVQRVGGRQTVTGIVVNARPAVPREERRRLRAILHGARKTGLKAQNREDRPYFEAWLRGKLAYLYMVDAEKGAKLLAELTKVRGS